MANQSTAIDKILMASHEDNGCYLTGAEVKEMAEAIIGMQSLVAHFMPQIRAILPTLKRVMNQMGYNLK